MDITWKLMIQRRFHKTALSHLAGWIAMFATSREAYCNLKAIFDLIINKREYQEAEGDDGTIYFRDGCTAFCKNLCRILDIDISMLRWFEVLKRSRAPVMDSSETPKYWIKGHVSFMDDKTFCDMGISMILDGPNTITSNNDAVEWRGSCILKDGHVMPHGEGILIFCRHRTCYMPGYIELNTYENNRIPSLFSLNKDKRLQYRTRFDYGKNVDLVNKKGKSVSFMQILQGTNFYIKRDELRIPHKTL